jgi:uncharacterized protein (TIGR02145 family)
MKIGKPLASLICRDGGLPFIIAIAIFISLAFSGTTSSQMPPRQAISLKPGDSLVVDKEGNRYHIKVFAENKLWMTTNLKLNVPGSYCYENKAENGEQYGRLYTWESALVGCSMLGEGWRLPTSAEWQQLSMLNGLISKDSNVIRKEAYNLLLNTGSSGFNALLGGGRTLDAKYARMEAHGFYWTATESNNSLAWFSNFAKGSQALFLQNDGEKTSAFSVRCVKNIGMLK